MSRAVRSRQSLAFSTSSSTCSRVDDERRRHDHRVAHGTHDEAVREAVVAAHEPDRAAVAEESPAAPCARPARSRPACRCRAPRRPAVVGELAACASGSTARSPRVTRSTIFSRRMIVEVLDRDRAAHRVPGPGEAVGELAALLDQHVRHPVRDHRAAERLVAGGDALGDRHEVRLDAEVLAAEPLAGAAETADHLVGDQQDPVLAADALDLRPVGRRRHDHAARALHRLADEGGDALRADLLDLLREPARGAQAVFLRRQVDAVLVPVRLLDVHDVRDRQAALRMHGGHAAQARRRHRAAVVGVDAADDDERLRLAQQVPVAARHAQDRVVRLGAGVA